MCGAVVKSTGLAIGDHGFNSSFSAFKCNSRHTFASVTKQYNLVPAQATHWPRDDGHAASAGARPKKQEISVTLWTVKLGKNFFQNAVTNLRSCSHQVAVLLASFHTTPIQLIMVKFNYSGNGTG